MCVVVVRYLNAVRSYRLHHLRGIEGTKLIQSLSIQGGILQGDGGDEVRLQT